MCQGLRAQARILGVSVASLFHLGWARVLAGLTGRQRVLGAEATERALGIFINTLPLRINLDNQDVQAAVRATHMRLTTLMRHEHAPLALAQRCSGVTAPTPLFNALLNYRHSSPGHASGETWQGIEVLHAEERSNYPLVVSVDDLGEAFGFTAQTSPGIDPQRICAYLQRTMQALLDALDPVDQIDIVPASERTHLLQDTRQRSDYQHSLTIHQRIEQQAAQHPDAIAAQVGEQRLSYTELNQRANSLAHYLIRLGVRADDRVAVVARRGLETLVGLLAVLKAGAPVAVLSQSSLLERLQNLVARESTAPLTRLEAASAEQPFA